MGAFGRDLIRHFGGDLDDYDGNNYTDKEKVLQTFI